MKAEGGVVAARSCHMSRAFKRRIKQDINLVMYVCLDYVMSWMSCYLVMTF